MRKQLSLTVLRGWKIARTTPSIRKFRNARCVSYSGDSLLPRITRQFSVWYPALLLAASLPVMANESMQLGSLQIERNSTVAGNLNVPAGDDGPGTSIPVTVFNGAEDGPTLTLMAGTHGAEYAPIIAMQQLTPKLDLEEMVGALIIVHIANLPAFTERTVYFGPTDLKNLNRSYPGNPNGTLTERIAHTITTEILDQSDYFIDIHAGDANEALLPSYSAYYWEAGGESVVAESRRLAVAFGLDTIVEFGGKLPQPSNRIYTSAQAVARGIPSIDIESGQLASSEPRFVQPIVDGSISVLRELEMIPGNPSPAQSPLMIRDRTRVNSEYDGIWYPDEKIDAGQFISEGTLLGKITDYHGRKLQDVRAPASGILLILIATPPVNRGESIVVIGSVAN